MLEGFDVEKIRFAAEARLRDELAALFSERGISARVYDTWYQRRKLRARALLLTEAIATDAVRALAEVKTRLGVSVPIELYQAEALEHYHGNALMHLGEPPSIEIVGHYLASLDHSALMAVLGHELGHLLAHGPGSVNDMARREIDVLEHDGGLRVAAELTADRFGLLACRDLDAALRLGMIATAGIGGSRIRLDTRAYLANCQAVVEEILADGGVSTGKTHPEHSVRSYAIWLFSESDVYRKLTGQGKGTRTLAEIDEHLARILPLSSPVLRYVPPPPPPPPSPAPRTNEIARAPAPTPAPAPVAAPDAPTSEVMRLGDALSGIGPQMGRAMRDIRAKMSVMLSSPTDPASPTAPVEVGDDEDELAKKFEILERRMKDK